MGIYVEKIGEWVDKYIFKPILTICFCIMAIACAIGLIAIPIAAIKYLLSG